MKLQTAGLVFALLLSLGFLGVSCSSGDTVTGGTGTGNTSGGAGTTGSGNTTGHAGTTGSGNTTGNAGTVGHAGTTGSGNVTGQAGTTGTGNVTGQAGTTGTGNVTGQAGTTGAGNITGTGSAGTTGTTTCSPSFQATTGGWVTMPSKSGGCWNGYAFAFTETPVCGSTITPANFSTCTTTCALTATGSVGAATAANSYCAVVGIGFNINQPMGATAGSTLAPTGSGIMVSFTETAGTDPFRVQLRDDSTATGYCFQVTGGSPAMIPYSSFNTKCYDTPIDGVAYAKTPFTSVQILIAGGAAATTFSMGITSVSEY